MQYKIDVDLAFQQVVVVSTGDAIIITGLVGEVLAEYTEPHQASATSATASAQEPAPPTHAVTAVLIHQLSPMS